MPNRKRALFLLLAAVAGGSALARAGQNAAPSGKADTTQTSAGRGAPLVITVSTDRKIYTAGAPIKLTLTARNTTREALHLTFSSGQKFDFEIRRGGRNGALLWQWARGKSFVQMLSGETLEPRSSLTYHALFDPKGAAKTTPPVTLAPGAYAVVGILTILQHKGPPGGSTAFRIQ